MMKVLLLEHRKGQMVVQYTVGVVMFTKVIKVIVVSTGLLVTPFIVAKETKVYTDGNVPSAEEMADILLNTNKEKKSSNFKLRSVSFGVAKKNPAGNPKSSVVSIGLPIKFKLNSSQLNPRSTVYLKKIGAMLNLPKMANERIRIIGHTDASGLESYNLDLSERRAQTVKDYLVSYFSISPARLEIIGKGETEPLSDQSPNSPLNRRVEIYRIP